MSPPIGCPDSLLPRLRQGTLTASEQRQLEAHLAHCEDCRISLEVGRAFDEVLDERPSDDLLAARIAARASGGSRSAGLGLRRLLTVAAAIVLITSATAVAVAAAPTLLRLWQEWRAPAPSPGTSHRPSAPPRSTAPAAVAPPEPELPAPPAAEVAPVPPPAAPAPPPRATSRPRSRPPVEAAAAPPAPTAVSLFADANARRRAGDAAGARARYAELQRRYPASSEAMVSRVSLGRLLLDRLGDPAAALAEFDGYLAQRRHATLAEEALFGRASALMRLGRHDEERQTWLELLRRFPTSIYAERALARTGQRR